MVPYRLNPYLTFIENRLYPGATQHAIFNRLTGEVFQPGDRLHAFLAAVQSANQISLSEERLNGVGGESDQLRQLIEKAFLVPESGDPLHAFLDQYAVRPIQNPALVYRSETGDSFVVRTSMAERVFSPKRGELPTVIEELMPPIAAEIFQLADGTRTLREVGNLLNPDDGGAILANSSIRAALEFLTSSERQLIKFTSASEDLDDPYKPCNTVPRNFYHSSRWEPTSLPGDSKSVIEFHKHGIEDAAWEFDLIEATVNHAFRFPGEALGGQDYGERFCLNVLQPTLVPLLARADRIEVLEVGGGTGSFARSFLQQAARLKSSVLDGIALNYQILDLSPALIRNQKEVLSSVAPGIQHFQQDATAFKIPDRKFDLIIANEVIADFPMASVRRRAIAENQNSEAVRNETDNWEGDGLPYVQKYDLFDEAAPESFLINAGVFEFIERAWEHLSPGGTVLMSEYGSESKYPVQCFHLNHEEFSIHFGHMTRCAEKIGFKCRLLKLKDFLGVDDEVLMLGGQEEHLLCLNQVLQKYGKPVPYAALSKRAVETHLSRLPEKLQLTGLSFLPLRRNFHFGPSLEDFMILIMNKPL